MNHTHKCECAEQVSTLTNDSCGLNGFHYFLQSLDVWMLMSKFLLLMVQMTSTLKGTVTQTDSFSISFSNTIYLW